MLFAAIGWVSSYNAGMFVSTRFWANLHPGPWMTSFIVIMIITTAFNVVLTISYYYLWTDLLGFYAPMPLSYYLPGTFTGFLSFFLAWFRYTPHSTLLQAEEKRASNSVPKCPFKQPQLASG